MPYVTFKTLAFEAAKSFFSKFYSYYPATNLSGSALFVLLSYITSKTLAFETSKSILLAKIKVGLLFPPVTFWQGSTP